MQLIYRGVQYEYTPRQPRSINSNQAAREVELNYRGVVYQTRRPVQPAILDSDLEYREVELIYRGTRYCKRVSIYPTSRKQSKMRRPEPAQSIAS